MNIEEMSRDELVFAEGSPRGSRRRARGINMGDECLRRSMKAYVGGNPNKLEILSFSIATSHNLAYYNSTRRSST